MLQHTAFCHYLKNAVPSLDFPFFVHHIDSAMENVK